MRFPLEFCSVEKGLSLHNQIRKIFSLSLSVSDVLIHDGRDIYSPSVCLKAMVWIGWLLARQRLLCKGSLRRFLKSFSGGQLLSWRSSETRNRTPMERMRALSCTSWLGSCSAIPNVASAEVATCAPWTAVA
jgi:hypothetical protein